MSAVKQNNISKILITAFGIVSLFEIIAEFYYNKKLLWLLKPFLMPLLIAYYVKKSKSPNIIFVISLIFSWIANLLFIERDFDHIIYGSIFFLIYRSLIIYLVFKLVKLPYLIPFVLGSIPFLFLYTTVCFLTFDMMGVSIFLFILHGIFIIILGGYSLGSYIMNSNKPNLFLFLSTIFFAISQFIFVLKLYSDHDLFLHSVAMVLFVMAQYFLTRFMIIKDNPKAKHDFVTNINEL